ncbi:DUF2846 domain-containing protein [Pseudomonas sp. SWRI111]|uniref:DUF2846 domain-containing protein n=1 Tax=Pseudomonas sp. SWRI111 TaxID=2745507 RepID=UPI001644532A|nr:DUF2846 domain-containing protein [Pseudomonas sp. SWRI111]MBC3207909.1 DUF2846 domain-containing protein [Pseudomonas sp. SWRI111]
MYRIVFFSCLMGILSLLQGCSSGPSLDNRPNYQGPAEVNSDSATVYVFRPLHSAARRVTLYIKLDDQQVAELPSGGYLKLQVPEGSHTFEAKTPPLGGPFIGDRFNLTVKKGNVYFIAGEILETRPTDNQTLGVVKDGLFGGERLFFRWAMVPKQTAEMRMSFCRLVPPSPI